MKTMSPAIKTLLEQVASWPQEDQEDFADYAREIEARRAGLYRMNEAEREGVERASRPCVKAGLPVTSA
jgi:hypothetical protein